MPAHRLNVPAGLLAAALLAGCGADSRPAPPARPPARVVSLSPSTTECTFALGLGSRLVGVTASCDYPEGARALPKVGGPTPDFERLVALRPDLVIGNRRMIGKTLDRVEALGLPVWGAASRSLEDLFTDLESLGRALGDEEAGRRLAESLRARRRRVRDALGEIPPDRRPRVLLEYWPDPVWTAGRGTSIDEAVTLAGGRNAAGPLLEGWGTLQWETILSAAPDVFVLAHGNREGCARRPGWETLRAAREQRILEVDRDLFARETPRLVDGIEQLAKYLHPDRF